MRLTSYVLKFFLALILISVVSVIVPAMAASRPKRETLEDLSRDAYIWGYPAVLMKKTKDSMIGTENPSANLNHFFHSSTVRDPNLRDVTGSNADSLFSWSWIELDQKPLVLIQPTMKDRYASASIVDAFGSMIRFLNAGDSMNAIEIYYLTGPKWRGLLPAGTKHISSSTSEVFILAQAYVRDANDAIPVARMMKRHQLIKWDDWQGGVRESSATFTAPSKKREIVSNNLASPGLVYFEELRQVIAKNNREGSDKISFTNVLADPEARKLVERGMYEGERQINDRLSKDVGSKVNGWSFELKVSPDSSDFLLKAAIAKERFLSVPDHQRINIRVDVDNESRQLNSVHEYELRFEKEDLPQTRAGWSLSIVPSRTRAIPDKTQKIYSVSENTLKSNPDGSVVILLQTETPDRGQHTNWLPIPANSNFALVLSAYGPGNSILNKKYIAPSLTRLEANTVPPQKIVRRMMAFFEPVSQ